MWPWSLKFMANKVSNYIVVCNGKIFHVEFQTFHILQCILYLISEMSVYVWEGQRSKICKIDKQDCLFTDHCNFSLVLEGETNYSNQLDRWKFTLFKNYTISVNINYRILLSLNHNFNWKSNFKNIPQLYKCSFCHYSLTQ